uniref:Putative secreted protein n=1 Tax=Ixodes ricinus TaxID=34613 RepID=A0A6B0U1X2_IXORI
MCWFIATFFFFFFVTRGCRMRCPQCIFNWLRNEAKLLSTVMFVWSRVLGFQLNWSSIAPALQGSLFFFFFSIIF